MILDLLTLSADDVLAWLQDQHSYHLAREMNLKRQLPRGRIASKTMYAIAAAEGRREAAHAAVTEWRNLMRSARERPQ